MSLFDAQTQLTAEAPTPYLKKKSVWNNLLIWWFYDQKIKKNIFLKKNFLKKSKKSRRYI
jgi:hypothetical protein